MKSKKFIKPLSGVAVFTLVLVGCSAEDLDNGGGGENGDVDAVTMDSLTVVNPGGTVDDLTPYATSTLTSNQPMKEMYEGLVHRDPVSFEIEPLLAEDWELIDETTWHFYLREGVTFHDGTDFNADAVVYTYDQVENNPNAVNPALVAPFDEVTAIDEHTVEITTNEPYGPMLDLLARTQLRIVSPEADQSGDLNDHPVGTGPYEFVEWVQGDYLDMTAYDDYWGSPPVIENVTRREVPDVNTALSLIETGEVDVVLAVPDSQAGRVEGMGGVELDTTDGTGVRYMTMNMDREPQNDILFREAVSMAIDRDAYIDHIGGLGQRTDSYAGAQTFGYFEEADDQGVDYDPDAAREIIEDNGWDGTELTLMSANDERSQDMATIIEGSLSEVGLNVDIQLLDQATFFERGQEGEADLTLNGWTSGGNSMLKDVLYSSNIGVSNYARYDDADFDALIDEAERTVDEDAAEEILHEANLYAMADMPWVVMRHDINVTAISDEAAESVVITTSGDAYPMKEDMVGE